MAQGTPAKFHGTTDRFGEAIFDLDTHVLKAKLITTVPTSSDGTPSGYPNTTDYTEVTGGTYAEITLTYTWTQTSGSTVLSLDTGTHTGGKITWAQDAASGPTNIKGMIVYETTGNAVIYGIDMTTDGSTAISMQAGDVAVTFDASGTPGRILALNRI